MKESILNRIADTPNWLIMRIAADAFTSGTITFSEFEEIQTAVQSDY